MTYYYIKGYNKKGEELYIIKTKQYLKEYKKKILNKHLIREQETIELLEIAEEKKLEYIIFWIFK